eukprot:3795949-Prymnesium_polylepis.1
MVPPSGRMVPKRFKGIPRQLYANGDAERDRETESLRAGEKGVPCTRVASLGRVTTHLDMCTRAIHF